jgi:acetyl-CoA carboxylase beta subunit
MTNKIQSATSKRNKHKKSYKVLKRKCEDCRKEVYRKIKTKTVVCRSCARKRYNDKRRHERSDRRSIIYSDEELPQLFADNKSVDFVPGDRTKFGFEKLGEVTEDDLEVIIVDGQPRIKGAIKLRRNGIVDDSELDKIRGSEFDTEVQDF